MPENKWRILIDKDGGSLRIIMLNNRIHLGEIQDFKSDLTLAQFELNEAVRNKETGIVEFKRMGTTE